MAAALPVTLFASCNFQIGFVNQVGSLKRVSRQADVAYVSGPSTAIRDRRAASTAQARIHPPYSNQLTEARFGASCYLASSGSRSCAGLYTSAKKLFTDDDTFLVRISCRQVGQTIYPDQVSWENIENFAKFKFK